MAHTLLQAYLDLPLGERDAALTSLVRSFGRREQSLVQSLISDTRDPFYQLPVEVLIYLFDFLHPYDVWSKRLICRRWNTALSSDTFTHAALNRFATHDPADSALAPEAPSTQTLALRHIQALRYGRPFSHVKFDDALASHPTPHSVARRLRLKGKHVAYLCRGTEPREGNAVVVRDLSTGDKTSLCGTAREKIMSIELTADIVAFFTYVGTVYIAPLLPLTASLDIVRLPSSSIVATGADRGILACVLSGTSTNTAVIHDSKTRKSTSFNLQSVHGDDEAVKDCHAILVSFNEQSVDVFSVTKQSLDPKLFVRVSRYSLAGECMAQTCLPIWHDLQELQKISLGSILPTGEHGLHQLPITYKGIKIRPRPQEESFYSESERTRDYRCMRWTLLFDTSTFTLKAVDHKYLCYRTEPRYYPNTALWKDRMYHSHENELSFLDTARRRQPFEGPRALRLMANMARCELAPEAWEPEEEEDEDEEEDNEVDPEDEAGARDMQNGQITYGWHLSSLRIWTKCNARVLEDAYRKSCGVPGERPFFTMIAMNDTFAVGTCLRSGRVGVLCFDERVDLHGAESTGHWIGPPMAIALS